MVGIIPKIAVVMPLHPAPLVGIRTVISAVSLPLVRKIGKSVGKAAIVETQIAVPWEIGLEVGIVHPWHPRIVLSVGIV